MCPKCGLNGPKHPSDEACQKALNQFFNKKLPQVLVKNGTSERKRPNGRI